MANKVSTQLLMERKDRRRARILAIVRDQVQAEVLRDLVNEALPKMEAEHAEAVAKLINRLGEEGIDMERGVEALLRGKHEFEEIMAMTPTALRKAARG